MEGVGWGEGEYYQSCLVQERSEAELSDWVCIGKASALLHTYARSMNA